MQHDDLASSQTHQPTALTRLQALDYLLELAHEDLHIDHITILTAMQYLDTLATTLPYSCELVVACLAVSYKVYQDSTFDTRYQANILGNRLVHTYQHQMLTLNLRPANFYRYLYLLLPASIHHVAKSGLHEEFDFLTRFICTDLIHYNPLTIICACFLLTKYQPHKYKPAYYCRLYRFIHVLSLIDVGHTQLIETLKKLKY